MAAQDYFGAVQQLYISYFGRPADPTGLQNMAAALDAIGAPKEFGALQQQVQADRAGTTALSRLVNTFNNSAESNALYGTGTSVADIQKFVAAIYQNVLGREADIGGFNFWVGEITAGRLTKANAAASITAAAMTNTTPQGLLDKATVEKKLAVANAFTTALDTPTEIISYNGDAAAATARTLLGAVTGTTVVADYQSSITAAIENMVAVANPGKTFELTASIDNVIGTNGNDNFVVTINADGNPIGSLDVIEGGAGRDTLSIADTSATALSLTGLTVRNVETLVASTSAALNTDISATGVTTATLSSAATTGTNTVTAGAATNVNLTSAGTANATVNGGKAVTVSGAGTNTVSGTALSSVTVNGGTAVIANNTASTANAGTTLTSVTLNEVKGANTIAGRGVTTVNLNDIDTAGTTVAISNSSTATAKPLTLNLGGVENVDVTAAAATALTINAAADSEIDVVAAAATTVVVTGAADLDLDLTGSNAVTSLDTSAATGEIALTGLAATAVTVKGGAGAERFTTTQTAKVAFDLGAGNDIVTVGTTIAAGSTINLGAGNDKLVKGAGSIATSTTTATTVVDGGAGTDTVAAGFINAGNANQYTNFEVLGLDASTLDVSLVTGTAFTGLELLAGGGTYTNITNAQGLAVNTAGVAGTTTLTFNNVTGAADAYTVTFGSDTAGTTSAPTAISAGTVSLAGIEAINVVSNAAAGVAANSITLADAAAQTVTVTGNQALTLNFATNFGATADKGVTSIDASAATAKVTINTTNVTAASAGLTVKGGTAGDVITVAGAATVDAGAGNDTVNLGGASTVNAGAGDDTIVVADAATTLTGGAGKDTFNVKAANGTDSMITITDFVAADDKIVFGDNATFGATRVNVSAATTFEQALNLAAAGTTGNDITWFQYGGNTYLVDDNGTGAAFGAADVVVKLVGTIDLSTATSSIVSAVVAPAAPAV